MHSRHPYDKMYLEEVMWNIGHLYQYSVDVLGVSIEKLTDDFINSEFAKGIERGNPHYMVGFTGSEILERLYSVEVPEVGIVPRREYWIGYALALIQWELGISFKEVLKKHSLERLNSLYPAYHCMDDGKIVSYVRGNR